MATDRQVARHGPFADFIANGVKVGNVVYLSGQVSVDDQGQVVAPGDIVAQSRQAYAHIRSTLEELGATMTDIVDETVFVTDINAAMANLEPLFAARAEAYGGQPQVSQTLVQVAALVMPELMIEIKCVAAL
ncbi:MAG: RidA family protein [Dehalococcoidia bacterium]